jgi:hypothetical protein
MLLRYMPIMVKTHHSRELHITSVTRNRCYINGLVNFEGVSGQE